LNTTEAAINDYRLNRLTIAESYFLTFEAQRNQVLAVPVLFTDRDCGFRLN